MRKFLAITSFAVLAGLGLTSLPAAAATGPQPDVLIRRSTSSMWKGDGVYGVQPVAVKLAPGATASYVWRLQNDGQQSGNFTLQVSKSSPVTRVRFFDGTEDVTPYVETNEIVVMVFPGESLDLTVQIKLKRTAPVGSMGTVTVGAATATSGGSVFDFAQITVRRK